MKDYVIVRYASFPTPDEPCEASECVTLKAKNKRKAAVAALWIFQRELQEGDELGSVFVMRVRKGTWYDPAIAAFKSAHQCCGGLARLGAYDRPDRHTGTCTEAPEEEKGL